MLRGTGEGRSFGHLQHGVEMKVGLSKDVVGEGTGLRGVWTATHCRHHGVSGDQSATKKVVYAEGTWTGSKEASEENQERSRLLRGEGLWSPASEQ